MRLSGPQLKELQAALISAYPSRHDLEVMVLYGLNENLSALAGSGGLEQTVFELLQWAGAREKCEELVKAAIKQNSRNPQLKQVAEQLGVLHDQILSSYAATPRLPGIWNIPYPRNPFFTGQEKVLTQLATTLRTGQATALSQPQAVSGLGGIGKTQIAIEFAYRHRQDYQAVLWVLSDSRESLVSGYIAIAQLLKLPEKDVQEEQVITGAVKVWLQTHDSWLLILDNADNLALVCEFLPLTFDGHVLITTRARATGVQAHRIEVEVMPEDIGALFLLRRAKLIALDGELAQVDATDATTAKEVCQELGGLPLALDQAGAYIEEVECSLQDYQQRYQSRRAWLLKRRGEMASDHPDSVATTWSLSFEKVEQRNALAADLLRVCAFLAPDAIAEEIIVEGAGNLGPSLALIAEDDLALDEAIAPLLAYSLIRRNMKKKTLSMHHLVQVMLKDGMDEQTRRQWAVRVVQAVNAVFPDEVKFRNWPQCERYLSHALVCADLVEQKQITLPEASHLLNLAGEYFYYRGRYSEAEPLFVCALAINEEQLGPTHSNTARSLNNLAALYEYQGKDKQAEPLIVRALLIREEQLGASHPHTALSLVHLGYIYRVQGKYVEAEPFYQRALSIYEEQLGSTHPDTAFSLNNLAGLYYAQGKHEQAEPLFVRALSIYEEQLGATHPDTALSLNNLAKIYVQQRKYAEAELLLQQALSIFEQQLGGLHPRTATCLSTLADLYQAQGGDAEAEPLLKRALSILEQTLGEAHPRTQVLQQQYASLLKTMRCSKE